MLRTAGDPVSVIPAVRRAVAAVDPDRPLAELATMERAAGGERAAARQPGAGDRRVRADRRAARGAGHLRCRGLCGGAAHARDRHPHRARRPQTREIVALVSRRALVFVSAGLAFGLAVALAATRLLESQLWGVSPTDPATFAGTVVLLALVAAAACFVPTRRAVRLNPTVALRE